MNVLDDFDRRMGFLICGIIYVPESMEKPPGLIRLAGIVVLVLYYH